jgi:hypothetical protein
MASVDRARLLDLLGRLGAESDEAALAAARELNRMIGEAGLSWDGLLRSEADIGRHDPRSGATSDATSDDRTSDDSAVAAAGDAHPTGGKAGVARLIERLLARSSISDTLREELEDFKRAIAEGTFEEMDAQYIRALAKRLGI